MINFIKKFDDKEENLGFFIPEWGVFKLLKHMTIKINYTNKNINKLASNLVLFCDEKYSISGIKKYISSRGIPFQVAMDKFGKTFKKFHGKSIPFLVVIDKEGVVTYTNDYLQDGFENDLIEKLQLN